MGFIQELRNKVELNEQEKKVRQELRTEEIKAAMAFRDESGIGSLAEEFVNLLNRKRYLEGSVNDFSRFNDGRVIYSRLADFRFCGQPDTEDGVIDKIEWDFAKGSLLEPWGLRKNKSLVIQVLPNGSIRFHARKIVSILESEWRNNPTVLEDALVQAFNNPGERIRIEE